MKVYNRRGIIINDHLTNKEISIHVQINSAIVHLSSVATPDLEKMLSEFISEE